MPRDSPAGRRWQSFAKELEHGTRLPGILPVEDVLLYGNKSLLVIAHFEMTTSRGAVNIRHALERLTYAFEALSSVHSRGITINAWPYRRFQTHDASFVCSHAFDFDDKTVADWPLPGVGAISHDPAYAPIVGRRFPRHIITRFPPAPVENDLTFALDAEPLRPRPWTPYRAAGNPCVPGPKLVSSYSLEGTTWANHPAAQFLWNFLWSSIDDRCDRACPTGERDTFAWEDTMLEQNLEPSFCYGLFHQTPWVFTTPNEECAPEQSALWEDDVLWWELTRPMPFDRFKRDVFELASRLIRSVDWRIHSAATQYEQLQDETGSKASLMLILPPGIPQKADITITAAIRECV